MIIMNAAEFRKSVESAIDIANEKPVFIDRTGDSLMLASFPFLESLIGECALTATRLIESDGSVTLALEEIDIAVNAPTTEEALTFLSKELLEYAIDYYDRFPQWSIAPNRKDHIPYVVKILLLKDIKKIEELIKCQDGTS